MFLKKKVFELVRFLQKSQKSNIYQIFRFLI